MAVAMTAVVAASMPIATHAQTTVASPHVYDIADGEAEMFGYLRYDTRFHDYGVIKLASNDYNGYQMVKSYGMIAGESSVFTAGTMIGDKMLAFRATYYTNVLMPDGICLVDPKTGDYEMKWQYPDDGSWLIIDEMTYDPKTGRIFAMHYDTDKFTTDLYEVDANTYELKRLYTIDSQALLTLAADNGYLYGLTYNTFGTSRLYRIDENNIEAGGSFVSTSDTGMRVGNYSQSMEFDKTTHRLWWIAQTNDDNSYMVELDTNTGKYISRNKINGKPQVLALSIPFQYVPDNAPSYVRSLHAEPLTTASHDVLVKWTNPTVDYRGNALKELSSVKIYRNSTLVYTIQNSAPGAEMSWSDTDVAQGSYIYKVVPCNASGDGVYRESRTFVGYDVPEAPRNATLTANGKNATITWEASQEGLNGGIIDKQSVTYDVVRMPDNKIVASATTNLTINDEAQIHAGYYYVITASNAQGKGGSAQTNVVAFGPSYAVPFISSLGTADDFDVWTPYDNNADGQTWTFEPYEKVACYDRSEEEDADDWLFTPALNFEAGKQYQVRYTYYTTNWVTQDFEPIMEKMDVTYGTEQKPSAMTTLIKDLGEFHTSSGQYLYGKDLFTPQAGDGYLAFHAKSEKVHGRIYLKDVSVREYSQKDLSVTGFNGSATVNSTIQQTFTVSVRNEGSDAVSDYIVQLYNTATGEVLGEAKGKTIGKDASVDVAVNWVPGSEGEIVVAARVVLDGDTYPADNVSPTTLKVKIAGAEDDKWLTLNNDENTGWLTPFYLSSKYYEGQCLFLEKEMQKKNIEVTGMQFFYNGSNTPAYSFPVRIYMKHSELSDLLQKEGSTKGIFEQSRWTKVYDGNLTVEGNEADTELNVKFDTPFLYEGGNVNIRFVIPENDNLLDTQYHPYWHFADTKGNNRFAFFRDDKNTVDNDNIYTEAYMPYIRLSYVDKNTAGVLTPFGDGMNISVHDGEIILSNTADLVEVFTPSGTIVCAVRGVNSIGTSVLPAGTYIVKAMKNDQTVVRKLTIK